MNNLIILLLMIFAGVALMVVLGERFARPVDAGHSNRLARWLWPLVGIMLLLSLLDYYLF